MANDEYREPQQAARAKGLEARHETRQERAIRRQVAEEIALAIEGMPWAASIWHSDHYEMCAAKAREIGSKGGQE